MPSDLQQFSYLNRTVATTLTDHDAPGANTGGRAMAVTLTTPQFTATKTDEPFEAPRGESGARAYLATRQGVLRTRLFVIDLVVVAACWVGLGFSLVQSSGVAGRFAPGATAAVVTLVAIRAMGLYRARLCSRKVDELWRILMSSLWGAAGFVVVQYQVTSPGRQVLVCVGAYIAMLATCRFLYGRWLRSQRAKGNHLRGVVLVGSNEDAMALETMLRSEPELGYLVTGVIGDSADASNWDCLPTSSSISSIPHLAAATGASGVLIVPFALSSASTQRAIDVAAAANLHVQVWPGSRGVGSQRLRHTPLSDEPFFYVEPRSTSRWQLAMKRALDVTGAVVCLILASPVIALAALLIKLEDRGSVLHRSERVGLHGRIYFVYKLRSMRPNDGPTPDLAALNERIDGPLFKVTNDPRTTKVGRLIRASSIDELPQLWNVLQGTMSLVGPRPALPSEAVQFDEELQRRHSVRPGVTGLWQVEARNNPSFNAYRRLDLRYVDNWSLWLDLTILASTVPAIATQALGSLRRTGRR